MLAEMTGANEKYITKKIDKRAHSVHNSKVILSLGNPTFSNIFPHARHVLMNIYIYIYVYKQHLALNKLHGLICHKTQSTVCLCLKSPYHPYFFSLHFFYLCIFDLFYLPNPFFLWVCLILWLWGSICR